ncbi:MAG: LPS export ABC transporter periplasmic protein LptC [Cyanobacteria bacterium NC_groundwater_1444_Ag_S-0.65um_54_12]|nr:LPS export ABC transporter periplasmic protein LptC [Cyanobacteria bacterium NC_groundwater_1444_Ag_S-0.65um_54_12]
MIRLFVILVSIVLVTGCQASSREAIATPDPGAPVQFAKVSLAEFVGNMKIWDLQAKRVGYDGQLANLEQVTLRYYRAGQPASVVEAPAARFNTMTRDLAMQGRVRMRSLSASTSFAANDIRWQAGSQRLRATGQIIFQRGPSYLLAEQLAADSSLQRIQLLGSVQATFSLAVPGSDRS